MFNTMKTILNGLDGTVRLAGVVMNLALVSVFAWATSTFYGKAAAANGAIGHVPKPELAALTAWATSPGATDKLIATGSLWVYAILAIGCGWMTLLGLRWCYHLVLSIVQQMKLQADKIAA